MKKTLPSHRDVELLLKTLQPSWNFLQDSTEEYNRLQAACVARERELEKDAKLVALQKEFRKVQDKLEAARKERQKKVSKAWKVFRANGVTEGLVNLLNILIEEEE